jgi:hypothetical protein
MHCILAVPVEYRLVQAFEHKLNPGIVLHIFCLGYNAFSNCNRIFIGGGGGGGGGGSATCARCLTSSPACGKKAIVDSIVGITSAGGAIGRVSHINGGSSSNKLLISPFILALL